MQPDIIKQNWSPIKNALHSKDLGTFDLILSVVTPWISLEPLCLFDVRQSIRTVRKHETLLNPRREPNASLRRNRETW